MSSTAFGIIGFCALLATVGTVAVVKPRTIPRLVNLCYSLIHMKTGFAEDDYDKLSYPGRRRFFCRNRRLVMLTSPV